MERSRAERYKTILDDKYTSGWYYWHLQLERLNAIDKGETDSLWYSLVCEALNARSMEDYARYARCIDRMRDCLNEDEQAELERLIDSSALPGMEA